MMKRQINKVETAKTMVLIISKRSQKTMKKKCRKSVFRLKQQDRKPKRELMKKLNDFER